MRKIPKELRSNIRKYSLMAAWMRIHEKDKKMQDKLNEVLEKIEITEDELKMSGVKSETFEKILKRANKFVTTPIGEMSDKQFETLNKLIFGQGTDTERFDRRVLKGRDVFLFDSAKYARWAKRE